jgi:hypothetical protein
MKKYLKYLSLLVLAVLMGTTTACTTADARASAAARPGAVFNGEAVEPECPICPDLDCDLTEVWPVMPEFMYFRGTVTEILPFYEYTEEGEVAVDDKFFVLVEGMPNEEEYVPTANFFITPDTLLLLDEDIEVGMVVKGYYETTLPTPAIYPPQHQARIFVSESFLMNDPAKFSAILVDRFDADLVAFNRPWQIAILEETEFSPATEIIFEDGSPLRRRHKRIGWPRTGSIIRNGCLSPLW